MPHDYDLIVIGAGSGGVRAARIAATHGAKVAVIEKAALGGTCVNVGCVPKKLFTYAADAHAAIEDAKGYGWSINSTPQFDWPTLRDNKTREIKRLNDIYAQLLENAGVTLIRGAAQFHDAHSLNVDGKIISAAKIIIAVGGTPRAGNFDGATHCFSSDEAFYLDSLPNRLAIVGGGYIAVEFAHIFIGLGVKVDLIYRGERILKNFDHDISTFLQTEMEKQGVRFHLNADIHHIEKDTDMTIHLNTGETLTTDACMLAIGRVPLTPALNLAAAGINVHDNGEVPVNDTYQTNIAHIYAIGDILPRAADLTPVAIAEGHFLADHLYAKDGRAAPDLSMLPTAVFSSPPIGTVGMSEAAAEKAGYDITVFKTDFRPMKYTLSGRDERCLMKLIVDKKTDKILGLHMCGTDTPEMLQGFSVALSMGATKADFDRTVAIHPTGAEELVTLR